VNALEIVVIVIVLVVLVLGIGGFIANGRRHRADDPALRSEVDAANEALAHARAVVDKPGTEEDQAVFRVVTDHGSEYLHLDRHGDTWVPR
jgi:hypothetical protein